MTKLTTLICLLSFPFLIAGPVSAADEADSGLNIQQEKAEVQKKREELKHAKRKAELLGDEEIKGLLHNMDQFLESNAKCYENEHQGELEVGLCIMVETKKLAESGNYIAQHGLGNMYEEMGEKTKAIDWYQRAIDNPKTPEMYKSEIHSDMKRAKLKISLLSALNLYQSSRIENSLLQC
jgi:tetratricopeptide (TPR) repeat protein